ncbi:MAG: prepilin peptidase, partial [Thermodesulfobacteriota bacterium]
MSLSWFHSLVALALGSVIGSFLNVCIYRLPRGESLVFPGSHCPLCGARIRWYDNVPLLSYLLLKGRCRDCRGRIAPRYPLVEAISAVLCLWVLARYGLSVTSAIHYVFVCALVVVAFIDLDHQIIPDLITYPGIAAGVAASFISPGVTLRDSLLGLLVGGGILLAVALVFRWIRKKEGLGMGDVK